MQGNKLWEEVSRFPNSCVHEINIKSHLYISPTFFLLMYSAVDVFAATVFSASRLLLGFIFLTRAKHPKVCKVCGTGMTEMASKLCSRNSDIHLSKRPCLWLVSLLFRLLAYILRAVYCDFWQGFKIKEKIWEKQWEKLYEKLWRGRAAVCGGIKDGYLY